MSEVVNKVVQLLYALTPNEYEKEWSASEISKELNMPVQTVHRLLSALAKHGLVYKNRETRKFRLGLGLMQLGFLVWENLSLRTIAYPYLQELAKKTRESVYLTVREGNEGVFIDSVDSPQMLKIAEPIGLRLPLHIGASKKVILAFLKERIQKQILSELTFDARTAATITSREKLLADLKLIRKQGYAISYGETTEGTAGIAAPLFSWDNEVVGAVSIAGPEVRFQRQRLPELIKAVKRTANDISEELGWIPPKKPFV